MRKRSIGIRRSGFDLMEDRVAPLYDSAAEMTAAMKNGAADTIRAPFDDYVVLAGKVQLSHWFTIQMSGDVLGEHVMESFLREAKRLHSAAISARNVEAGSDFTLAGDARP